MNLADARPEQLTEFIEQSSQLFERGEWPSTRECCDDEKSTENKR